MGNRHMRPLCFCTKLNSEQLLFKALFDVMNIFGSIEPLSKSTFLFQYIIIFQRWQSSIFGAPRSTPLGDRHKRCTKLMLNNFYLKHFLIPCIFLAALSSKVNLLSHFGSLWYFKDANLWSPLASLLWEIDICAPELFFTKLISEQLLFEAFFDIMPIFGKVEPLSKSTFPFQ